jgi:multiple sugar transport system substrate-binding protein
MAAATRRQVGRRWAWGLAGVGAGASGVFGAACGAAGPSGGAAPAGGTGARRVAGGAAVFMATGDAERSQIRDGLLPRLEETTGVKGQWIHATGTGYYDKLFSMMASDTAPDLFLFAPSYFVELASTSRLRNVSPLIKRDKYDLADFPEKSILQYTWQGNQHGFPQDFPTRALFYNVELFRRAGITPPPGDYNAPTSAWTWPTFLEAARKLTGADAAAGSGPYGWNTQFGLRQYSVWVYSNGAELFNKEMTESLFTEAKVVDSLQWMADLIHRHGVSPTRQVTQTEKYDTMFTAGRAAMVESLPGALNTFRSAQGFVFDVAPIPSGGGARACTGGGSGYGMYGGTKNEDAAWEFFKFIEGPEAQLAHARSGATFPSRKSIQLHPEVAVPGRAPEHFKLFVDGQRFVRLDPQVSNWRDIEAAIDAELGPLWEGQRPAREAAMAVKRVVDPMLKEAAARKPRDQ